MRGMFRIVLFLLISTAAWAGTVRLVNDSAYQLTAVIRAADGTKLGELNVPAQQTMSWNSYWGGVGNIQYNDVSQTPYTVLWFCPEGAPFSVCQGVSTGSTVTALSCDGTKSCKQKTKPSGPTYPPEIPPTPAPQQPPQGSNPGASSIK